MELREYISAMVGRKFGRWTVLSFSHKNINRAIVYNCLCDCGVKKSVNGQILRSGGSKSCGCLKSDVSRSKTLSKNPHWKGGRYINDSGYVMVYMPSHKRAQSNGYVREHILISEAAIGRPLPDSAQVHHYGHVSDNSKIIICENQEYHYLLHLRERAIEACGNPDFRKCKFCHEYDDIKNMYVNQSKHHGWNVYHRECQNEYDKKARNARF